MVTINDYGRRKFRSETSANTDSWKIRGGKSYPEKPSRIKKRQLQVWAQKGEEKKWEDQRRKKMQVREKVGKSRFTVVFQWFVALGGRKVGSLKRRVRMKKCTPLWREAHFQVKTSKTPHARTNFWRSDVEKVHAVVARSTFPSQNAQKGQMHGPLLTVEMWFYVAGTRDCAPCQKWAKREGFAAVSTTTTTTIRYTTVDYTAQHSTTLHYTTPHYTTLHYTTIHYTTLHSG